MVSHRKRSPPDLWPRWPLYAAVTGRDGYAAQSPPNFTARRRCHETPSADIMHSLLVTALALAPEAPRLEDRYQCAACATHHRFGDNICRRLGSCRWTSEAGMCDNDVCLGKAPLNASAKAVSPVQLRVSMGFGTKSYGTLRVSAITDAALPAPFAGATYSEPFRYKWTQHALHTFVTSVPTGQRVPFAGDGFNTTLWLPKQGAGVAGVLIADPCVSGSVVGCSFQRRFHTDERTMALIDMFAKHDDIDYWGILGDNFYDQSGDITAQEYAKLSLPTLSKIMLSVPGNHDYWVLGSPLVGTGADQFGNGFMQWYAQDSRAGRHDTPTNSSMPFDFSADPGHSVLGGDKPQIDNHHFYHQIGNTAFIGYSGAYSLDELMVQMVEACAWLPSQPGIEMAVLLGHWDIPGLGATEQTATPGMYEHVKDLPGCDAFDRKGMLKFIMGHTHCNAVHPHGHVDTGFMVAGMGMEGCGNYGVPVLDTTGGNVTFWYFSVVDEDGTDTYEAVHDCVSTRGWRQCTHLAVKWLEQPLI